ncbi:uncharacterized protein LOC104448771 [Eucalyptus grandis]|uniref:uncharacterized protein LOC104448771 n=1 Tax=Eucalyptus grandis TaxID=71139 RepID=UPI00192EDEAE|nr:uncharacterized protein LOC104448771 [Eucalyptus grandis]
MSGRIIVVILFFWALLTFVTPTLVHLSESSKLKLRLHGENIDTEALRARKEFGFLKKPLASKPLDMARTKAPVPAAVPAPSPSPAPEPQPASSRVNRNQAQ